jgi:MFS family permease
MADGVLSVGGQSYLIAAASTSRLGLTSAFYFLGGTLGSSLGSLVAGPIVQAYGFAAYGKLSMALATMLILLGGRYLPALAPAAARPAHSGGFSSVTITRNLALVGALRLLPTWFWGIATLVTPLLLYRLAGNVVSVSAYFATSLTVAACCQLLTGRISDRISLGGPVLVLGALLPVAALGLAYGARDYSTLFVAGVFATAVAWSLSVNIPPLVRAFARPGEQGRALGSVHLLWVCGMLFGGITGGLLVQVDSALPYLLGAALNLPTPFIGWMLWRACRDPAVEASATTGGGH